MINAVVFDLDGVLIDSERFWKKAEEKLLNQFNLKLPANLHLKTQGMRTRDIIEYWYELTPDQKELSAKTRQDMINQLHNDVLQQIEENGTPMLGAQYVLDYFLSLKIPMAVASSSSMEIIRSAIERLKFTDYFSCFCSGESELLGKPHPAVYLTACHQLGFPPEHCLAFEDSINGLIAAKAARMKVVAIPSHAVINPDQFSLAEFTLNNLTEFSDAHWSCLNNNSTEQS